jgi:thioredoxin
MPIIDGNSKNIPTEGVVLVDFWAPWCGPCKMLSPNLEQLSKEREELNIIKISVDQNPKDAADFNVMSVPTLILIKDGIEINRKTGVLDVEGLKGFIDITK